MTKLLRMTLAASVAALTLAATPAAAAPVGPDRNATARARVLRPLQLLWVQDFNLGTVLLSGPGPFSATVDLSSAGVLTCPASVTCSGTTTVATYNVRGTNNQVVTISAPDVTLSDGAGNTLLLDVTGPASVTLTNSGAPGNNFSLGGRITVSDTTVDGIYNGTFNVTVDYQ